MEGAATRYVLTLLVLFGMCRLLVSAGTPSVPLELIRGIQPSAASLP